MFGLPSRSRNNGLRQVFTLELPAMWFDRRLAVVTLILFASLGCKDLRNVGNAISGKAQATLFYWAKLQGIQWHGDNELNGLWQANAAIVKEYDVDGVSRGFAAVSEKHASIATQLMDLDSKNVDKIAVEYRDRLAKAHTALAEVNKKYSDAAMARDQKGLVSGNANLKTLMTQYVELSNEKDEIITKLEDIYDQDFDVAE